MNNSKEQSYISNEEINGVWCMVNELGHIAVLNVI